MALLVPEVQEHLPLECRGIMWVIASLWGLQSGQLYSCQPQRKETNQRRAWKTTGSLCYFQTSKEDSSLGSLKSISLKAVQLVWQRPQGYDSMLGYLPVMASLSVLDVRICCVFFFFPKSKDGLLYLMNTYSLKVLGSLKMFLFYLFYSNGEGASLKAQQIIVQDLPTHPLPIFCYQSGREHRKLHHFLWRGRIMHLFPQIRGAE